MAGRPKMTEDEKARAKAAREAAKSGAGAAADRAEARSTNGKTNPAPKPAPTAARVNSDDLDREEKALFHRHLPLVVAARKAVAEATNHLRTLYKGAKAEGNFTKADFDTAIGLETAEKEARERAKIARQLRIAQIMGSSLGAQLDMFLEPDRTPASEIAFQEGEKDAMQNVSGGARPKYDPSTEQYREYMRGFHSASEKRINAGISKLHPEVEKDAERVAAEKATVDQQKAVDAKAFEKPTPEEAKPDADEIPANPTPSPASGVPMTRAQFKAQEAARKAAEG